MSDCQSLSDSSCPREEREGGIMPCVQRMGASGCLSAVCAEPRKPGPGRREGRAARIATRTCSVPTLRHTCRMECPVFRAPAREVWFPPFYRCENWGPESLCDILWAPRPVSCMCEAPHQAFLPPNPMALVETQVGPGLGPQWDQFMKMLQNSRLLPLQQMPWARTWGWAPPVPLFLQHGGKLRLAVYAGENQTGVEGLDCWNRPSLWRK